MWEDSCELQDIDGQMEMFRLSPIQRERRRVIPGCGGSAVSGPSDKPAENSNESDEESEGRRGSGLCGVDGGLWAEFGVAFGASYVVRWRDNWLSGPKGDAQGDRRCSNGPFRGSVIS